MNFYEYQAAALRTAKRFPSQAQDLNHSVLGLLTEAGEFATEVKRAVIYERPITAEMRTHMIEELGDALWYIALAAEALGVSMHLMAELNIEKLMLRFPEKYTNAAAEARADKGGLPAARS